MKIATLESALRALQVEHLALQTASGKITVGELLKAAMKLRDSLPRGQKLALANYDLSEALVAMVAADGFCEAIALCSATLPPETCNELLEVVMPFGALVSKSLENKLLCPTSITAEGLGKLVAVEDCEVPTKTRWILTTSGTTGQPKLVGHNLLGLTRTTRRDQTRTARQVWGLLYDYTRFAGLQVVLQSLLSGATLVAPDLETPLSEQLSALADAGVTHLSATPTLWRKILMTPGHERLALCQITLGGEIANDMILDSLARKWPEARISHIFASTEAGVGFSVSDGKSGFPRSYLIDPPSGIELMIDDGRLWVKNPNVIPHYLHNASAKLGLNGWIDTGDVVEVTGDRILFRGRLSGVINVGGNKVLPEEVERVLLAHPGVAMAHVYAKQNPITGDIVAAEIVPVEGVDATTLRDAVRKHAATHLARHMVPSLLKVVENCQTNMAGKIIRGG